MRLLLWIALAGAAGTLLRYGIGTWLQPGSDGGFPWGTLAVNITGSFILGFAFRYLDRLPGDVELRTIVGAGFCGGYTTFSAFGLETVRMMQDGKTARAAFYVGASVLLGLIAVIAGLTLATMVKRS